MSEKIDEKLNLVKNNLQECIGENILKKCLLESNTFSVYWGTAPTGRPHIAYFLPMSKLADFLKAGCGVTVLFANLHAFLDNMKAPWELLDKRTEYYEILIKGVLKALNVPIDKLKFIRGTDFQLSEEYTSSVFKIVELTSIHDALKAGCEVVKQNFDPLITSLIYPLLQSLDEEYLHVDAQFGGLDQRKIFMYAAKYLPMLGFSKRAHLMNPMIPGLSGSKMSASEEDSKIDLLDDSETMKRKIQNSKNVGDTEKSNAILAFLKHVIWAIKSKLNIPELNRFTNYDDLELDYKNKRISEETLKSIVETALVTMMSNLKDEFTLVGKESLIEEAYPKFPTEIQELNETMTILSQHLESLHLQFPQSIQSSWNSAQVVKYNKPRILWTCRASGLPHIGYFVPIRKLAELSRQGWNVIILIEDIGAFLHSNYSPNKPSWNSMKKRSETYRKTLKILFNIFNGDEKNLEILVGSEFQLTKEYALLMYKYMARITLFDCTNILKNMIEKNPEDNKEDKKELEISDLSSVVYLCLNVINQVYLKVTVRLLGDDKFAKDFENFAKSCESKFQQTGIMPIIVTHPLILSLDCFGKMKSSKLNSNKNEDNSTTISIFDKLINIDKKIRRSKFDPKSPDNSFCLNILELIIFPSLTSKNFTVKRSLEHGGDVIFNNILDIKSSLINNSMHPEDVKITIINYLENLFFNPFSKNFDINDENLDKIFSIDNTGRQQLKKDEDFNPNSIDLKVAKVKSVCYLKGSYEIKLIIENEEFVFQSSSSNSVTPNDLCLMVMKIPLNSKKSKPIGWLFVKKESQLSPVVLKLKETSIANPIQFSNYCLIDKDLKETDEERLQEVIHQYCLLKSGKILWANENSFANVECVLDMKNTVDIHLELF